VTGTYRARATATGSGTVHCSAMMRRDPARATGSGTLTCSARVTGWGSPTCSGTARATVTWTGWARASYSAMARARTCSATGWVQVMTCSPRATVPHWSCWARVTAMCWRMRRCWAGPPAGFRQRLHHRPPWRVARPTAGQAPASCAACERFCGCVLRRSSRLLGRMPRRNGSKRARESTAGNTERPAADHPWSLPGRLVLTGHSPDPARWPPGSTGPPRPAG